MVAPLTQYPMDSILTYLVVLSEVGEGLVKKDEGRALLEFLDGQSRPGVGFAAGRGQDNAASDLRAGRLGLKTEF